MNFRINPELQDFGSKLGFLPFGNHEVITKPTFDCTLL